MTDLQHERYDALLRAYMHVCDTMYYQAHVGAGDNGLWKAEERYLAVILTSAGGKEWFEENSSCISPGFLSALIKLIQQYESSVTDNLSVRYHKLGVPVTEKTHNKLRLQGAFGAGRRNRRPSLKRYVSTGFEI